MKKRNKGSVGRQGEFLVAAELEKRGYCVAMNRTGAPFFDMLAYNPNNHSIQFCIQVKTTKAKKASWIMKKNAADIDNKNVFYILVKFETNDYGKYSFYILPSKIVASAVKKDHDIWMSKKGKNGEKHNDSSVRKFYIDNIDDYLENWKILESYENIR